MKILVGILHSIENEFDECLMSIEKQTFKNFDRFIISNLPNKEAHDQLYETFMSSARDYDLFIKIDADMVITSELFFENIVKRFSESAELKSIEITVHDFFCNKPIWGLHAYRNTVTWKKSPDQLLVDFVYERPFNKSERIRDDSQMAPAAYHCPNPSLFQSFHYGIHKALKIIQPDRGPVVPQWCKYHWQIIRDIRNNFIIGNDIRVGMALLGAELGLAGMVKVEHLNYTNPELKKIFDSYKNLDLKGIKKIIKNLHFLNFGLMPESIQKNLLIKVNRPDTLLNSAHKKLFTFGQSFLY